jgi:hypothetical protein
MPGTVYIEILVHPTMKKVAVRPSTSENRSSIIWGIKSGTRIDPRMIPCAAYFNMLFSMFDWNTDNRYRLFGAVVQTGKEIAFLFDANEPGVFLKASVLHDPQKDPKTVMNRSGKRVGVLPATMSCCFGKEFLYEQSFSALHSMTKEEWKLRLEGQLFSNRNELHVTSYEELRAYIDEQLQCIDLWRAMDHEQ